MHIIICYEHNPRERNSNEMFRWPGRKTRRDCGEKLRRYSWESGCKKLHKQSSTHSTRDKTKYLSPRDSGSGATQSSVRDSTFSVLHFVSGAPKLVLQPFSLQKPFRPSQELVKGSVKTRKERTWAIAVGRGSYKPLFLLNSAHFFIRKKGN